MDKGCNYGWFRLESTCGHTLLITLFQQPSLHACVEARGWGNSLGRSRECSEKDLGLRENGQTDPQCC